DKQIAPDAVGVPQDAVHRLMDEYLHDYEFKTSFGVGTSLFDQGKIRYTTQQIGLREHFRCMPEIIRFSNDLCYSGGPLIPLRQYGADRLKPLEKVYVPNGYREGRGGRVINHPEAEVIAAKIVELCGHSQYTGKTMGVVILQGEAQASLIEHILLEQLGAEEMECRRLICGNPYSFQGDERDVIFMSMVAAPNERIGPLTKLADERRFNVAASRAKDQMWLFHSVTRNDLNQSCLRSRLLEFFEDNPVDPIENVDCEKLERQAFEINRSVVGPPQPFDSWFEVDVALELARKKYRVIPQFEVAGKYIDLVIDGGGSRLAVECDGDAFHGVDHYEQDMERQKILERCGWAFFRIRECEFCTNKDAVLFKLWRALEDRQIFPIGMEPVPKESEKGSHIPEDEDPKNIGGETLGKIPASRGQLFHPLEGINDPSNIHEAMQMNYSALRDAIIATLKSRPNQSCVKDSVVKYLLQYLEIISRGKPREAFAYKVDQVIRRMDEAGILKIYTATNERVKLKPEPYLSMALGKDFVSE
ncbi:MAG: AAA family ATPase, partial [Planctomycetota bacterium]